MPGSTPVRVIRVIEYTYDSLEFCLEDRTRWTTTLSTRHMTMKSIALDPGPHGDFKSPWERVSELEDEIKRLKERTTDGS